MTFKIDVNYIQMIINELEHPIIFINNLLNIINDTYINYVSNAYYCRNLWCSKNK
jgi:hypothetical protein